MTHLLKGRSLILGMIDFAPQLESSKLLTENLLTYCQMIGEADNLDKLERDWASKILWVIRAYGKPSKQSLPLRVKDILAPLNRDYNYRYCFGNAAIADILKDLNTHQFNQQQSIKRLTDFGSAVSVIEAI